MRYVLEPMLFALDENCSEKEFKNFVKRIIRWERWLEEHPDDVYMLSSTEEILSNKMAYPVYPLFQKMMDKYKVTYVKACDLNKSISKLLRETKKIDTIDGCSIINDAIVTNVELRADSNGLQVCSEGRDSLGDILWSVYCRTKTEGEKADTYLVFAKNLSDKVTLNVKYKTIEDDKEDYVDNEASVTIKCHSSLKEFFSNENTPDTILSNVQKKKDLQLALRVSIYQKGGLNKWADAFDNFKFTIQDSFYKDYCDAHYADNTTIKNRLMDEMSNVMLNRHLSQREDWRVDKGGNAGQLCKNGYLAWRWFVTQSVKMMYWQNAGDYKFANVKEHDIFVCQWEN